MDYAKDVQSPNVDPIGATLLILAFPPPQRVDVARPLQDMRIEEFVHHLPHNPMFSSTCK